MQFFFRNCTHILTRTHGEKFEDMFLVKTANKGTSLASTQTPQLFSALRQFENSLTTISSVCFCFFSDLLRSPMLVLCHVLVLPKESCLGSP